MCQPRPALVRLDSSGTGSEPEEEENMPASGSSDPGVLV